MKRIGIISSLLVLALLLETTLVFAQSPLPVEILVTGRQPGPPLWRVTNGDNVLWIFPWLSPVPKDMEWDSGKVEAVIAEAEEVLGMPDVDVDLPLLLMLNPFNIVRGMRLAKRLTRNAGGASLQEVLPVELYERFVVLKTSYFPRDKDIEKLRPLVAAGRMSGIVEREAGLVSGRDIRDRIQRLIKKNRRIRRSDIEVKLVVDGNFRSLANRAETMLGSLSAEQELACFEARLSRLEQELGDMRERANAWARGYVDELRGLPLPGSVDDICAVMVFTSSESGTVQDIFAEMNSRWLEAAEQALARNRTTFAVLDIRQLLQEDGLMTQMKTRGYEVREP